MPAIQQIKSRTAKAASSLSLLAATIFGGCHHEPALPAKPPVAVRLADVTLYQSTEGLRYSASLIPYARLILPSAQRVTLPELSRSGQPMAALAILGRETTSPGELRWHRFGYRI